MVKFQPVQVVRFDDEEFLILSVPQKKNQVNYTAVSENGKVYKIRNEILDNLGEFVRFDSAWATDHANGVMRTKSQAAVQLVSGDEVMVRNSGSKDIEGKTAYVVKVNNKTVQIVVPRVGAWNVSPNLLVKG